MDALIALIKDDCTETKMRRWLTHVFKNNTICEIPVSVPDFYDGGVLKLRRKDLASRWIGHVFGFDVSVEVDYEGVMTGGVFTRQIAYTKLTPEQRKHVKTVVRLFNSLSVV